MSPIQLAILGALSRALPTPLSTAETHKRAGFYTHPNIEGVARRLRTMEHQGLVRRAPGNCHVLWLITPMGNEALKGAK